MKMMCHDDPVLHTGNRESRFYHENRQNVLKSKKQELKLPFKHTGIT